MKPTQYQKGYVEFYKLRFKVTPDVLIPRPETELLVDEVLNYVSQLQPVTCNSSSLSDLGVEDLLSLVILDLGTGAGNIAISIAKNAPDVRIIATDISPKALKVARQNAKLHGVKNRIKFIKSDLLSNIKCTHFERSTNIQSLIIVANLPYIPSARIPYLDPSVKDFEPYIALDGGEDGFELYRNLFRQINQLQLSTPGVNPKLHSRCVHSKPRFIVCEIDYTHGELAVLEAQKHFPDAEIEVKKDLTHLQRILYISWEDISKNLDLENVVQPYQDT